MLKKPGFFRLESSRLHRAMLDGMTACQLKTVRRYLSFLRFRQECIAYVAYLI
jgi:hypothetical protein